MKKQLMVRTNDKMVFKINRETLEAESISYYDAYCFSHPEYNVEYISMSKWDSMRDKLNAQK